MGERPFAECLEEQLKTLRTAAHGKLQDWYDDGHDARALDVTTHVNGLEAVHQACGYLDGAADALDVTVLELVESNGLSFDRPLRVKLAADPATKRQRIRKVAR